MRASKFLVFMVCLALSSCDYGHSREYEVKNMTGTQIEVLFRVPQGNDTSIVDSLSVQQIYRDFFISGGPEVDDERYEDNIDDIKIRAFDTIVAIPESRWAFLEHDESGFYSMQIDSTDFQ